MALKDWKKLNKNQWKRKNINLYVTIKNPYPKNYMVGIHKNKDPSYSDMRSLTAYKTKGEALKVARNFMRNV